MPINMGNDTHAASAIVSILDGLKPVLLKKIIEH